MIIEGIMKGLAIWLHNLFLEIVEFIADALLQVFNMDMAYFESNVPISKEIAAVILGAGWALLIGNLAFQAVKSMMSGIGFEGEDPKILFARSFVFAFLLIVSRQICTAGLSMTSTLNTMMQTPDAVDLSLPQLDLLAFPASWLLIIIINIVLMRIAYTRTGLYPETPYRSLASSRSNTKPVVSILKSGKRLLFPILFFSPAKTITFTLAGILLIYSSGILIKPF